MSSGVGVTLDRTEERRVAFESAKLALEQGDALLAQNILSRLAETAGSDTAERKVFEALLDRSSGRPSAYEERLRSLRGTLDRASFEDPWVYAAFIDLLAELNLEDERRQAAQALEELLQRHYDARGGLARLLELDNIRVSGRRLGSGVESRFLLLRKRPSMYRMEVATPEVTTVVATDGAVGWRSVPTAPKADVTELRPESAAAFIQQARFDELLVRYKATGEILVLRGTEEVAGVEVYRIDVMTPGAERESVYLDATSYLEVRRVRWRSEGEQPVVMTFEYRDVNGIQMISRQDITTSDGILTFIFGAYVIGEAIDPAVFDPVTGGSISLLESDGDPTAGG